jgi:hypothetical protein
MALIVFIKAAKPLLSLIVICGYSPTLIVVDASIFLV